MAQILHVIETFAHLGMVLETTGGLSGGQVPQTQGLVPGTGQSVVAVRRQNNVADEVAVAVQTLLGDTVVGFVTGQLPHDQGLVWKMEIENTTHEYATSHSGIILVIYDETT